MHAEYYTLTGNHIKEEIVYFQKMRLGIGKWVSRRPLIMKEVNWWAYTSLFQKDRLFSKLVLRHPFSVQMEIFHLILRYWYNRLKEYIFPLLVNVRLLMELCHKLIYFDLNWLWLCKFTKGERDGLWFQFWHVQCLCDINKIFVENIGNFVFFWNWAFFFN